jgi:hypothetical protein
MNNGDFFPLKIILAVIDQMGEKAEIDFNFRVRKWV